MIVSDNFKIIEVLPLQPTGKIIIQAFNGSGLVASLASQHLINHLGMVEKGHISSNLIPSVGLVRDGVVQRPVRIYESEKYILLISEVAIIEENLVEFVEYLFDWYNSMDPAQIIIIGALPTGRPSNASDLRYNVVASDEETREFLGEKGIWTMPQGAIYGSVALSLMESKRSSISCYCILAHCIATIPDYLAAKKVIEVFNAALDETVNLAELEAQALELKEHLNHDHKKDEDEFDFEGYELYDDDYDDYDEDDDDDDFNVFI